MYDEDAESLDYISRKIDDAMQKVKNGSKLVDGHDNPDFMDGYISAYEYLSSQFAYCTSLQAYLDAFEECVRFGNDTYSEYMYNNYNNAGESPKERFVYGKYSCALLLSNLIGEILEDY